MTSSLSSTLSPSNDWCHIPLILRAHERIWNCLFIRRNARPHRAPKSAALGKSKSPSSGWRSLWCNSCYRWRNHVGHTFGQLWNNAKVINHITLRNLQHAIQGWLTVTMFRQQQQDELSTVIFFFSEKEINRKTNLRRVFNVESPHVSTWTKKNQITICWRFDWCSLRFPVFSTWPIKSTLHLLSCFQCLNCGKISPQVLRALSHPSVTDPMNPDLVDFFPSPSENLASPASL